MIDEWTCDEEIDGFLAATHRSSSGSFTMEKLQQLEG